MSTPDSCCSIVPYFKVAEGKLAEFKALCTQFVERTKAEPGCLYYGFCFDGDIAHCREGYRDATAVLAHLQNVGQLLEEAMRLSTLVRLEMMGPAAELAKLREPLAPYRAQFFNLECGFRR